MKRRSTTVTPYHWEFEGGFLRGQIKLVFYGRTKGGTGEMQKITIVFHPSLFLSFCQAITRKVTQSFKAFKDATSETLDKILI